MTTDPTGEGHLHTHASQADENRRWLLRQWFTWEDRYKSLRVKFWLLFVAWVITAISWGYLYAQ